ncbi:hypothetical protein [Sorangium sp. So ce1078]|uniref:hypothetical protein n=1 Tax=Sorangium sp. So ce1078 TaxID=3133329 RepID=UPI003F600E9C
MRRDRRSIRTASAAILLAAAGAVGCNAIIGLEVGELGSSASGTGTGGGAEGGAGAGAGGSADGGGGGAEEAFCRADREGAVRGPQGRWGATAGLDVTDVAAHGDGVTAIVNEKGAISVRRWTDGGTSDGGYGLTASDLLGGDIKATHLSVSRGLAYVAGWSDGGTRLPGASDGCLISGIELYHPSFLAALDEKGQCRWAWAPDGGITSTPLGLAAASGAVVIAASVDGPSVSERACAIATGSDASSVGLAALDLEAGRCLWSYTLGPAPAVGLGELVADEARGEVLAIGHYEAAGGLVVGGTLLPPSEDRDLFVARFALTERSLKSVDPIPLPGNQEVEQRGAALLPGGDVVIVGPYAGSIDLGDDCPPAPDEDEAGMENFFVMRVSGHAVVWGRGFGATGTQQWVTGVATGADGLIYVTGSYKGEIDLGNGGSLFAPSADTSPMVGFLLVLDDRGNVVSASDFKGTGNAYVWAAAPGPAPGDPLHLGGELGSTLEVGLDAPLSDEAGRGFVVELWGVQ